MGVYFTEKATRKNLTFHPYRIKRAAGIPIVHREEGPPGIIIPHVDLHSIHGDRAEKRERNCNICIDSVINPLRGRKTGNKVL